MKLFAELYNGFKLHACFLYMRPLTHIGGSIGGLQSSGEKVS